MIKTSPIIEALEWRYATKKFDPTKQIDANTWQQIKQAINLSASSYGLQPYKVLNIQNKSTRKNLVAASWNQKQVEDASHFLVFCHNTQLTKAHVDEMLQRMATKRELPETQMAKRSEFIWGKIADKDVDQRQHWAAKQAYLALGNLLTVAASLRIDACPMEGFEPAAYVELLGLQKDPFQPAVACALGYRAEEDAYQHQAKVRKAVAENWG